MTKQKDLSKFHRHLLNRLDHGAAEETPRERKSTELRRRSSERERERSSHSEMERERDRNGERRQQRSESEDDREKQGRERRRSGEERRRSRHHSDKSDKEVPLATTKTIESKDGEHQGQEAAATRIEETEEGMEKGSRLSDVGENGPKLPSELTKEDREERRKAAATKRTDSQAQLSAKEKYLARKRARTSAPVINKDDD